MYRAVASPSRPQGQAPGKLPIFFPFSPLFFPFFLIFPVFVADFSKFLPPAAPPPLPCLETFPSALKQPWKHFRHFRLHPDNIGTISVIFVSTQTTLEPFPSALKKPWNHLPLQHPGNLVTICFSAPQQPWNHFLSCTPTTLEPFASAPKQPWNQQSQRPCSPMHLLSNILMFIPWFF